MHKDIKNWQKGCALRIRFRGHSTVLGRPTALCSIICFAIAYNSNRQKGGEMTCQNKNRCA